MEFFGFMVFMLALINIGTSSKVKRLARKVKALERGSRGKKDMSQLIQDLVGKQCMIIMDGDISIGGVTPFEIVAADEEWVKLSQTSKNGKVTSRIVRIDNIRELRPVD